MGKLSSHKYVDNVDTESDKKNHVDMSDYRDSTERYGIGKNDEETLTDVD